MKLCDETFFQVFSSLVGELNFGLCTVENGEISKSVQAIHTKIKGKPHSCGDTLKKPRRNFSSTGEHSEHE